MNPQNKPFARRSDGRAEVLSSAIRLRWSFDDLVTADGHRLSVAFGCGIKSAAAAADRKLFVEVFMTGRDTVTADDLTAHFSSALKTSAGNIAGKQKAESALSEEARGMWTDDLRKVADEIAFSCGLEILPPFDIEVTSPTLQQERMEQMQRTAAERRSADRVGHLARAADLLKQWESLKASVPSITPGKLLEQLNPADRGAMLETLLMATGVESNAAPPDLWAVAGPSLARIDLTGEPPVPKLLPMPATAGPLRSVRAVDGKILIGARGGVLVVDRANPDSAEVYLHPNLISEHGFSSVIMTGDRLWGCHRDAGLVGWTVGQTDKPIIVLSPKDLNGDAKSLARGRDGDVVFAVGSQLMRINSAGKLSAIFTFAAPLIGVLSADGRIIAAAEDGSVAAFDSQTMEKIDESGRSGKLTGAALLPWLGSHRLLLARADGPIECVGFEDQLVTQFGGHTSVRAITACGGKVAAMSSDRQRVILWNAWDGRKPAREIYLAGAARHRVADIAFG
jgi:hypothetical protein